MVKKIINCFSSSVLLYVMAFFLMDKMPNHTSKNGILNNSLNFLYLIQEKAEFVAHSMQETNLALNFIGNIHKISPFESKIFQDSGLVHLLAISGAQMLPVVSLFSFITSSIVFFLFRKKNKPHKIMQFNNIISTFLAFAISLFISLLFGGTGALLRVSWLNFFNKLKFFQLFVFQLLSPFKEILKPTIEKFILIAIISIFFGNVFLNYSFILSAIGASCAEICAYIWTIITKNKGYNFICKVTKNKLFAETSVGILTCILVGIILSPLTYNSILNSCFANIFAIPLVTFIVTPLSLFILILPVNNYFFHLTKDFLDYSLLFFKKIAYIFSNAESVNQPLYNLKLFSTEGLLYLNIIMVVLWVIVDIIRSRREIKLKIKWNKNVNVCG